MSTGGGSDLERSLSAMRRQDFKAAFKHLIDGYESETDLLEVCQCYMYLLAEFGFYEKAQRLEAILLAPEGLGAKAGKLEMGKQLLRLAEIEKAHARPEAKLYFQRAIHLLPDDENFVLAYARFLEDGGEYQEAITIIKNFLELSPEAKDALVLLGTIYHEAGLREAGQKTWELVRKKFPRSAEALTFSEILG